MKKIILFFLFINISVYSFSQIAQSSFPAAGDTVLFNNLFISPTTLLSDIDVSGTGQIWDYSTHFSNNTDTLIFYPSSAITQSSFFPQSELAATIHTESESELFSSISFLKNENNDVVRTGVLYTVGDGLDSIKSFHNSSLTFFSFPLNAGNSFSDTVITTLVLEGALVNLPVDSGKQVRTIYRHDTIDGTGQLKVPGYTFNNVYRNKMTDVYVDSIYTFTTGSGWSFFEAKHDTITYILWHQSGDFFTAIIESKNDTVRHFYVPLPPPPSLRLEFANLQTQVTQDVTLPDFQVMALRKSDNSLATEFNDSIFVYQIPPGNPPSFYGFIGAQAVNGIATFSGNYFHTPGTYSLVALAKTDTVEHDTLSIVVVPGPDHIQINNLQAAAMEQQVLSPFEVVMYNSLAGVDPLFQGEIYLGKLSGSGKISGTTVKQAVNGIAVFDDISINHTDQYNLVAWANSTSFPFVQPYIDSADVSITQNPELQWGALGTDTLSLYVDRAQFFVWTGNADGFLSGTSREWYDEIGQHFDFSQKGRINQVIFYGASWYNVNTIANDTYKVKIYNAGVEVKQPVSGFSRILSDSLSLNLLGEQTFTQADFHTTDFFIRTPTVITFDTPVEVYSDFIVALEVNNEMANDTIIIWASTIGDGMGEHRTSRRVIENYPGMNPGWVHDNDWRPQFDVDFMIMPVIDVDTADIITGLNAIKPNKVTLYPNPASDILNIITSEPIDKVTIKDISGRMLYSYLPDMPENRMSVATENISTGLYTIEISFKKSGPVKEKLVILKP